MCWTDGDVDRQDSRRPAVLSVGHSPGAIVFIIIISFGSWLESRRSTTALLAASLLLLLLLLLPRRRNIDGDDYALQGCKRRDGGY